ncbi:MAG: DUF2061 domain-containing protein [Candidatus Aenigmarchaeota archaeon]|nr:DUF2061 domain-containing protein [Candidatus Aenigmarchaeota archaeon]
MKYVKKSIFEESRLRSLLKSVIYRILSIIGTAVIIWVVTRNIEQMISLTIYIQIFLIVLYYLHERVWNKISWGRKLWKK